MRSGVNSGGRRGLRAEELGAEPGARPTAGAEPAQDHGQAALVGGEHELVVLGRDGLTHLEPLEGVAGGLAGPPFAREPAHLLSPARAARSRAR